MREIARQIVMHAFANKTDKAGKPYVDHLFRVASKVPDHGVDHELKTIAILHDLLEDCPEWTEGALRVFFSDRVVDTVIMLTRGRSESYDAYIERILKDSWACRVKKADLEDNMDLTRLSYLNEKDIDRIKKYHEAYIKILNAI